MARRPRASKAAAAAGAVAKSNGISADLIKEYIERFDALEQELASEKGKFMKKAKDIAEARKELFTEGKTRGINPKALKTEMKCSRLSAKILAERNALEGEDAEQAELIRNAIIAINTPLEPETADEKKAADASLADSLTGDDEDDD
ncbi:hypothetical protein [Bosea massiliensis]|uniref:GapR-like DNA-binding domain-containing protein n=1 Tax=Bosea massiliensis TaxID=151419 RepID=A0ABW0P9L7_9HYPH